MKIRKDVDLDVLESYKYHYENNLVFPVYKKIISYGRNSIVIEIPIQSRIVYINKNPDISSNQQKYIEDLKRDHLIE